MLFDSEMTHDKPYIRTWYTVPIHVTFVMSLFGVLRRDWG